MSHHRTTSSPGRAIAGRLLAISIVISGGCASSGAGGERVEETGESDQTEPPSSDEATYPYSERQLKEALEVGSRINLRIEDQGKTTFEDLIVTEATPESLTIVTQVVTEDGKVLEDKGPRVLSWDELRAEIEMPEGKTVRSEGQITVPVGEHETWLYVVSGEDDAGKSTQSYYHFAKALPGPPVLTTVTVDGRMTKRITMVGRR